MTLQQLRTLIAIVRFGSFRRAARELGVSQAGLTTSLQGLEDELQLQLLVRSAQGVSLTEAGRQVYERALLIERQATQIAQEAERTKSGDGGTLSVGLGPTATALLLPRVVPDFHARMPEVRLRVYGGVYEQMEVALEQGRMELAVTAVPVEGIAPSLVSAPLYRSDMVVVARAGHPVRTARSLAELSRCEWVLMGPPGQPGGSIGRYHADQGLPPPRVAATCETLMQLAALVRGTDWLAMVPLVMVQQGHLGAGLQVLELAEQPPLYDVCVIHRREPALAPAAQAFAAMCESCARAVPWLRRLR